MDDGIYVSERQRRRKRRKVGTAVAVAALALGAGAYAATAWAMNRNAQVTGVGPLAPSIAVTVTPPLPDVTAASLPAVPTVGPPPGTMSAARRSWRPSPVPSPSGLTDDEMAALEVSRLLQPRPIPAGQAVAADAATVRNELTPGGTQLRIVSARYDLTEQWKLLGAADTGRPIGAARCTQNFKLDDVPSPQNRPGLLLCWRTSAAKSIVVLATSSSGHPAPAAGEAAIRQEWLSMG